MKYANQRRTRQTFTLTGVEHRWSRDGNERLVCFVEGEEGLLAIWGRTGTNMGHILDIEQTGFPLTLECDWIEPDAYEARALGHRYWVAEADHLVILRSSPR